MPPVMTTLAKAIASFVLASVCASTLAADAAYPTRPARLVVGFGVGGGVDTLARMIAPKLGDVTYKGGGQASAALLANEVQVRIGAAASTIPVVQSGRLRALAIASGKRSRLLPDLPTVAELGYPDYEVNVWYALLAPAGTPRSVIERIRAETVKALQDSDVQAQLERTGVNPMTSTPAELGKRIAAETALHAALIKDLDIRVQ